MPPLIELRKHPRKKALIKVSFVPNGHGVVALDVSMGGARLGLLDAWRPARGAIFPVSFLPDTDESIALRCRITRVEADHVGVAFEPGQDEDIQRLLEVAKLG